MFVNNGWYRTKSWIVCDDKGYSYRLVGVGGVFRSYSVGTWDAVNASYFLAEGMTDCIHVC